MNLQSIQSHPRNLMHMHSMPSFITQKLHYHHQELLPEIQIKQKVQIAVVRMSPSFEESLDLRHPCIWVGQVLKSPVLSIGAPNLPVDPAAVGDLRGLPVLAVCLDCAMEAQICESHHPPPAPIPSSAVDQPPILGHKSTFLQAAAPRGSSFSSALASRHAG
jgi:hypothetical protein